MATIAISALPVATAAATTDVLPIVQGGTTKQITNALLFTDATLVTPALGTPASGVVTNLTGTASININGTVGATIANTGAFTTLSASGTTTLSGNQIISVTNNINAALRITQLGTGNALLVEDSTNPDATPFVIDASGRAISGYTSAITTGSFTAPVQLHANTSSSANAGYSAFNWNSSAAGAGYNFFKSRGDTIGTPSIVNNADTVGFTQYFAYDGASWLSCASIAGQVDGTPGANDMPGRLLFSTTADGAATPTERMRIDSSGNVRVTGGGGLGYGTGSGGVVTQATSRTTGVTINKTTGAITLFSAAGTTAATTFTVTNSTVAATDVIILSQKSGTDLYDLMVTAVAAGSFNITFRTTGGTTTETPVFNFAVINGVAA